MTRSIIARTIAVSCAILWAAAPATASTHSYRVTIDTAPLVAHTAAPFALLVTLTDGSGTGDASSTVTLRVENFGGGTGWANTLAHGGAEGTLATFVRLTDRVPFNTFSESFTPGTTLQLGITIVTADAPVDVPDRVSIFILDGSGARIPTQSPAADYLFGADLGWMADPPQAFGSDLARAPSAGGAIAMAQPSVSSTCAGDVSARSGIVRSGFVLNTGTGLFAQTVKLTNNTSSVITGPIYLALDNLTGVAGVVNSVGVTSCASPANSPTVPIVPNDLAPGATASVVLQFINPAKGAIAYTARTLAGSASR